MVTAQEALKAAIEALEYTQANSQFDYDRTLRLCKTALSEIGKSEPVGELILDPMFLPALKVPLVNWASNLTDLEIGTKFYTAPQPHVWVE